ncbi:hypothetical protein ACWD5R_11380 [Streptomyces sp. NPDC002514]|uniref:hypothetical protein n=1 Tax=Streptomyces sp. NPDC001270 TaxID=3364554 RepID=UPI0036B30705
MSSTKRTQPTPPKTGARPTVRVTDDAFAEDIADLMRAHDTFADAVRQAVGQLAALYRTAWAHGIVPRGTAPTLAAYQFAERPTRENFTASKNAASSDPRRAYRGIGQFTRTTPTEHFRQQ